MRINAYQSLAAALVIVTAAILAEVLKPRELMAKASSVDLESSIPREFGEWKELPGVLLITPATPEGVLDPSEEATRVYTQEVARAYVNRDGQMVMLMVAYGPVQNYRLKAHRPEICYSAGGFRVSEKFGSTLTVGANQTINLTRLVTQRETRFEPVTYWMRVGNDVVNGIVDRQLVRIKYGLQGLIPDGALVRFSTIGMNRDQSFAVQDRFIRDFLNAVEPSKRSYFAGA